MKNTNTSKILSKATDLKSSENYELSSGSSLKNKINLPYYIRIRSLYHRWWKILNYTVLVYVYFYVTSKVTTPVLQQTLKIGENIKKNSSIYRIVGFTIIIAFSIIKGVIFCADGFVSSLLKTPFGQICYAINKSGLDDRLADNLVNQITEINENFKETFKKFGILNISEEIIFLTNSILGFAVKKSSSEFKDVAMQIKAATDSSHAIWAIAFLVPIVYSFKISFSVKRAIDEILPIFDEEQ